MTYEKAMSKGTSQRIAMKLVALCLAGGFVLAGLSSAQAQNLEERVSQLERETAGHDNRLIKWHLSGYASAGFDFAKTDNDPEGTTNTFTPVQFSPIFHFLYSDLVLFQGELEFSIDNDGNTSTELEYASVALLAHDNFALVLGKWLSPIGQFQERLHPSWVNKLPTAPAGFGHGGIAPLTDLGLQVRGGALLGGVQVGYTAYVSNGPQLTLHHGRVEVENEATASSRDQKAFGGRFSVIPIPHVELGVSGILANSLTGDVANLQTRPDYRLAAVDGAYTAGPWDVRFEYMDSKLDAFIDAQGDPAPALNGSLWYAQAAYQFGSWEPVIRYGELQYRAWNAGSNTLVERKTKRTTIGINYLFAPSLIGKLAYESDSLDFADDQQRFMIQVAYGF